MFHLFLIGFEDWQRKGESGTLFLKFLFWFLTEATGTYQRLYAYSMLDWHTALLQECIRGLCNSEGEAAGCVASDQGSTLAPGNRTFVLYSNTLYFAADRIACFVHLLLLVVWETWGNPSTVMWWFWYRFSSSVGIGQDWLDWQRSILSLWQKHFSLPSLFFCSRLFPACFGAHMGPQKHSV